MSTSDAVSPPHRSRSRGLGRVLILAYALLALAATGRSIYQLFSEFDRAPFAYSLSALAGVIYIVATIALVAPGRRWLVVAVATIGVELVGVLVVGTLSIIDPVLFPEKTVWSIFGRGYAFVPLLLPIIGLTWLWFSRPRREVTSS
jgi:hypothetical protein